MQEQRDELEREHYELFSNNQQGNSSFSGFQLYTLCNYEQIEPTLANKLASGKRLDSRKTGRRIRDNPPASIIR